MTVWWADLTAADAALEAGLPARERARLDELTTGADRARRAVGAALLQEAVRAHRAASEDREAPEALVAVDRTCERCGAQHGRPVVAGGPHVSVAHAGVLVVVATCADAPVGVDVERAARFDHDVARARDWVAHEARVKAGAEGSGAEDPVVELGAPLPGYVAALAVTGTATPRVTVRHRQGGTPG